MRTHWYIVNIYNYFVFFSKITCVLLKKNFLVTGYWTFENQIIYSNNCSVNLSSTFILEDDACFVITFIDYYETTDSDSIESSTTTSTITTTITTPTTLESATKFSTLSSTTNYPNSLQTGSTLTLSTTLTLPKTTFLNGY